ncbi:MAG: hypothetical protein E4H37_06410, partial [Gemmatimonadales bacterium]
MTNDRIYRVTSIGRPLDPSYRTNLAVLVLMPVAAVVAALVAAIRGDPAGAIAAQALVGPAAAFGAWALARELAPDDNPAAFVSMALAFAASLTVASPSLLLLFTTLGMVRIVNRTVGPPARLTDSLVVLGLILATAWIIRSPVLPVVGAVAFALDASLEDGTRRQLAFAMLALVGAAVALGVVDTATESHTLPVATGALIGIVSVGFGIAIARTRRVSSVADMTGQPLSVNRVRAGMFIALLVAVQAVLLGTEGLELSALVWATLAGVAIGGVGNR